MPAMIFHTAYPLNRKAVGASGLRPVAMRDAFEAAGYTVFEITGYAAERKQRIAQLRKKLAAGQHFEFLYSENATIPAMVTEPRHFPPHFLLDFSLFRLCRAHHIPTSVFYRDAYWRFPLYREHVKEPLRSIMKATYRYELRGYDAYADVLFLPSREMIPYLPPMRSARCIPLPPGASIIDDGSIIGDAATATSLVSTDTTTPAAHTATPSAHKTLNIFYIGGLGGHYRLLNMVHAAATIPDIHFTMCVPKDNWERCQDEYHEVLSTPNITLIHASGPERDALYATADICYVPMEPHSYGAFAAPLKLYEYIGRGKPIIAVDNTVTANVVTHNGIGWTTENSAAALSELIHYLLAHPDDVQEKREQCRRIRNEHTWERRAQYVAEILTQKSQ
ncbi:glycosyltransferase [Trueperella sp. LYQ143]|uniref:glycosyltransferase n=1 Tax=unclassified Trueperella TaxID=2630174 RepID=UPI00398377EC